MEDARDDVLSCLIALLRPEASGELLAIVPEDRRDRLTATIARFEGVRGMALERLRAVTSPASWASLPKPLQHWLASRKQAVHG